MKAFGKVNAAIESVAFSDTIVKFLNEGIRPRSDDQVVVAPA
jgi:hypothetical protein